MHNVNPNCPHHAQQALGQAPTTPIAKSSWLMLGALAVGLYLWSTSVRTQSKAF